MQLRTAPRSHAAAVLAASSTSHRSGRALASAPVAFVGGWARVRPRAVTAGDDYLDDYETVVSGGPRIAPWQLWPFERLRIRRAIATARVQADTAADAGDDEIADAFEKIIVQLEAIATARETATASTDG